MARLAFNLNNGNEFVFDLDLDHMSLGRTSENDIVIANSYISGRHCVFRRDPLSGLWEVVDLNSQNGVMVNGVRVDRSQLQHGDKVALGQVEARFHLTGQRALLPSKGGATSRIPKGGEAAGDTSRAHQVAPGRDDAPSGSPPAFAQPPPPAQRQTRTVSFPKPVIANRLAAQESPQKPADMGGTSATTPREGPTGVPGDVAQLKKDLAATRQILAKRTASMEQSEKALAAAKNEIGQLREELDLLIANSSDLNLRTKEPSALDEHSAGVVTLATAERCSDEGVELELALAPVRSALVAATAELEALRQAALQEERNRNEAADAVTRLQTQAMAIRTEITALEEQRSRENASLIELRCSLEMGRHEAMRQEGLLSKVDAKVEEFSELQRRISQAEQEWMLLNHRNFVASAASREIQDGSRETSEVEFQSSSPPWQTAEQGPDTRQHRGSGATMSQIATGTAGLTVGLIRRVDLLDTLLVHASRRGDTAPELIGQISALRSSLIDLLREAGVEEISVPAGTPIDLDLRRRIKIVERSHTSGDGMAKVLETLRPGFISALATGGDLVLRKVEVKTG